MVRVPPERIDHPLHTKFSATTSLFQITFLTILLLNLSIAPFLSKPSDFFSLGRAA